MPPIIVWIFLLVSGMFATVHNLAVTTSLYWYYTWFDSIMHFWGGGLIVLGVYAICALKHVPLKPTTVLIFSILFLLMISWEIFEWKAGLFEPGFHLMETAKDIFVGFIGGLLGYLAAIKLRS